MNRLRASILSAPLGLMLALSMLPVPAARAQQASHQTPQRFDQNSAHLAAGEMIDDADVHASLNLNVSILQNLDAGFRYTYQVQPSYQAGLFTRIDRWTPHVDVHVPKVMATIEPGAEIVFLRQFPNEASALKALPHFDVHQIPLTAENALSLNPGDVVQLPVHLDILLGPQGSAHTGPLEVYGRGNYVLRGLYQIQALRLPDERVRLRLVATRQEGLEGEVGARLRLDVFELGLANKAFQGLFGKRLGSIGFGKGPKGLVMADYIFDLSSAEARSAYNRLLSSDRLLTNFKLVNPLVKKTDLQRMFVSDLSEVDRIAELDASKPADRRRITQVFKGHNSGSSETFGIDASLFHLLSFRRSSSLSQDNHIVFLDSGNERQDFLAPVHQRSKRLRFLFGLRSEQTVRKASIITKSDEEGRPSRMGEYVVSLEIKDKHMGESETRRALENLNRNIAPTVIERLAISPLLTATSYSNARVYAQVIFNESAMAAFEGLSQEKLVAEFNKQLKTIRQGSQHDVDEWVRHRQGKVLKLSERIASAFDRARPLKERIRSFMDLQRDRFFRTYGTGFLMSLLPPDRLDRLLSVDLRVDATTFKAPVEAHFGTSEFSGVVQAAEYIEHLLDQGSFDLRLETFGSDGANGGLGAPGAS